MNKALIISALTAALSGANAAADEYPVLGGGKGGSYERAAKVLSKFLGNEFPEHTFPVQTTSGSEFNLKALAKGSGSIAMAQMDAYATWLATANDSATVNAVGPLYKECVWLVGNKKGKVTDEDDLQSSGKSVAIGEPGSGSVITWGYMKTLEPGYGEATTAFVKPSKVLGPLAMNAANVPAHSAMWTSRCDDPNTKALKIVESQKMLRLIDVDDSDLNDDHPTMGSPVYEFVKVKAAGQKITTIAMTAAVFASDGLPENVSDELSNIVLRIK